MLHKRYNMLHKKFVPRILLVEGPTSVGKCFLLNHLLYLWAKVKLPMKIKVLLLLYIQLQVLLFIHNMKSLHDLAHHFYGYDNMLVRLLLLILLNSYKMEENLTQYCWMGIMNIQMIYDNTVLLLTLESGHNHQKPIIIEIVQSKCPAICLQCTENKRYY